MAGETLIEAGQDPTAAKAAATADPTKGGQEGAQGAAPGVGEDGKPKAGEGAELGEDGKPKAGEDGKPKASEGAPEAYEAFTAPEGVTLDAELMGEFSVLAKELNLNQANAQKLVDLGAKMTQQQVSSLNTAMDQKRTEWREASVSDKEFGGDKLNENLAIAKKGMEAFASPEMRTFLNDTGLGNHPEFIRHFFRVGKAISEDQLITSERGKGQPNGSLEQRAQQQLYGTT